MKPLAYLLLFGLFAGTPMVFAQEDAEPETTESAEAEPEVDEKALKKAANRYWSTKMARMKKAASALKKVKDKKSAEKTAKSLAKLCKKENKKPEDSEFMAAAEKRYQMHISRLEEQIDEQVQRIEELSDTAMGTSSESVMTDALKQAIDKACE